MSVRSFGVAFQGVEARLIEVQCLLSPGLPGFHIVGLPDKSVNESKERVRAALMALHIAMPSQRVTVNLSPAHIPKEGAHFDLPIALAVLGALGAVPKESIARVVSMGELSLSGKLAPVQGALPAAVSAAAEGFALICPASSAPEAAWINDCTVNGAETLLQITQHLNGTDPILPATQGIAPAQETSLCLSEIRGQAQAKRALEIAAAGRHNLLMVGPPGAGKSMLAARIPSLLPPMGADEILETSIVHSVAGRLSHAGLTTQRPFCAPHHSASRASMVGGGRKASPGQISLAHNGVLFLDELPEFPRTVLESLRQPLESGAVNVTRAEYQLTYPARFLLVAAANPCRCGHVQDPSQACARAPICGQDYLSKISGPLIDRIDLRIELPAVSIQDLEGPKTGETSQEIADRVAKARRLQANRYAAYPDIRTNADAPGPLLDDLAKLDRDARALLSRAADHQNLTARGYHRVRRIARTIADLDGSPQISRTHLAEALWLRIPKLLAP